MHGTFGLCHDTQIRRFVRRVLAFIGLAALILAAGLDAADAATGESAPGAGTPWLAFVVLAFVLFAVFRWASPARIRRPATPHRRKAVARVRRR